MAKLKQQGKVPCPCCGKQRDATDLSQLEMAIAAHQATPWWEKPGWTAEFARRGKLSWACRECLHSRRAIAASPWLQTFCDLPPILAHFDRVKRCEVCSGAFTFGASEQRYWYEQLKFWVQSVPKQCPTCRRAHRQHSKAQAELAAVLEGLDSKDPVQLGKAAAALLAAGSRRKAAEFLRKAKNLARDEALRARLIQELESIENQ